MSDESSLEQALLANDAGGFAKSVGVPPVPSSSQVPIAWKMVCREIMLKYAEEPVRTGRGASKSAGAIRDEIMRPYDIIKPNGTPDRVGSPLSRTLFEHFFHSATNLNDTSFAFVDNFVRKLQLDDAYSSMFAELIDYRSSLHRVTLKDLYCSRDAGHTSVSSKIIKSFEGCMFRSPKFVWGESHSTYHDKVAYSNERPPYVFLYIGEVVDDVAKVSAIYSENETFINDPSIIKRLTVFHGYILPTRSIEKKKLEDDERYRQCGTGEYVLKLFCRSHTGSISSVETSSSMLQYRPFAVPEEEFFRIEGFPFIGNLMKGELLMQGLRYKSPQNDRFIGSIKGFDLYQVKKLDKLTITALNILHDKYLLW